MAERSIKLFLFNQKFYFAAGIRPPEPNQIHHSLNWKNVILSIASAQSMLSAIAFLLFEAQSANVGICVLFLMGLILGSSLYSIVAQQRENISEFIENCEAFIETSMLVVSTHATKSSVICF